MTAKQANAASNVVALHAVAPQRKTHVKLTADQRAEVMARIKSMDEPGTADYDRLACQFRISRRGVERIVTKVRADAPRSPVTNRVLPNPLPDDALLQCSIYRSMSGAWEHFRLEGTYRASYPQFTRQMNRQHGANVVRGACRGLDAMDRTVFMEVDARPFMSMVTIDLFYIRAPLTVGNRTLDRAVGMLVREDHTDTLMNACIFEEPPTSAMVASALGQAFRGRTYEMGGLDQGPLFVGGLPDFVFCDNEELFHSKEIDDLLGGLGVRTINSNSYSSNENGKLERLHGTLRKRLLSLLPCSSDGSTENGELMNADEQPLDLQTAQKLLASFAAVHNTGQLIARKAGPSPLERWHNADPEQQLIRRPKPKEIAHLAFEHHTTCKRYKLGVLLANEHYYNDKLPDAPGRRFLVGRWFGDPDHVELFSSDGRTYYGTATRNGAHTAAEAQATMQKRADDKATVREVTTAAGPERIKAVQTKMSKQLASSPISAAIFPDTGDSTAAKGPDAADEPQVDADEATPNARDDNPDNPSAQDDALTESQSTEDKATTPPILSMRDLVAELTLPDVRQHHDRDGDPLPEQGSTP